jgi:hypothetical protein
MTADAKDPSECELPSLRAELATTVSHFVLQNAKPFPALEELRRSRDAAIAARAALGPSLAEAAIAARLDRSIADLRELVYAARCALALAR